MTKEEKGLIDTIKKLKNVSNRYMMITIFQNYIQQNGSISKEAGDIIKDLLKDV